MAKINKEDRPMCSCGRKMIIVEYSSYYETFNYFDCGYCEVDPDDYKADDYTMVLMPSESEETEMKKDIEWAIKEIKGLETEPSQNYPHDEMIEKEIVLGILNQLKEPEVLSQELPVIPQFVADWIEAAKKSGYDLLRVIYDGAYNENVRNWMFEGKENKRYSNRNKITCAWLYGYAVEKEPRYIIKIGNLYLAEPLGDMTSDIVRMTRDKGVAYQFTDEKSIATHLDKFEGTEAVKVEEMEEWQELIKKNMKC